jgi:Ca2+-binding RTX toxin-like protein
VSGILFEQVAPGKGDINLAGYDLSALGAGGVAFYPWGNWNYSTQTASAIHFGADIQANGYGDVLMSTAAETAGAFAYPTLLHEIGHALGLKHPTDSWTLYPLGVDHNQWDPNIAYDGNFSIMSPGGSGSTLTDITATDIQAIQSIYGTSAAQASQFTSWSWNATTYTLTATLKNGGQTVRGVSMSNTIAGAAGDDTIYAIGQGTNRIYGKAGDDTLVGGSGVNYLDGGAGGDNLNGWFSVNTYASYADAPATGGLGVTVNLLKAWLNTGDAAGDVYLNIHKVQGSAYADAITGDNAGDFLLGGAGGDTITGGAGVDHLYGQAGNDTLIAGAGISYLDGGAGADVLVGSAGHASYASYYDATAAVTVNLLTPGANAGDAAGDSYANIRDVLGSNFGDTITGDNTGDVLMGGAGDDSITGGSRNDVLIGGAGVDTLTGGLGADQFRYCALSEIGDKITDFTSAQADKIAVSAAAFGGGLVAGPLSASHFAIDAPNAATGQMIWNGAGHTLSWDADGMGSGAARLVATLQGVTTLTAANILVF